MYGDRKLDLFCKLRQKKAQNVELNFPWEISKESQRLHPGTFSFLLIKKIWVWFTNEERSREKLAERALGASSHKIQTLPPPAHFG
jgi:hypothetical protein